eukprot:1300475-Rhodomonas_salina.2
MAHNYITNLQRGGVYNAFPYGNAPEIPSRYHHHLLLHQNHQNHQNHQQQQQQQQHQKRVTTEGEPKLKKRKQHETPDAEVLWFPGFKRLISYLEKEKRRQWSNIVAPGLVLSVGPAVLQHAMLNRDKKNIFDDIIKRRNCRSKIWIRILPLVKENKMLPDGIVMATMVKKLRYFLEKVISNFALANACIVVAVDKFAYSDTSKQLTYNLFDFGAKMDSYEMIEFLPQNIGQTGDEDGVIVVHSPSYITSALLHGHAVVRKKKVLLRETFCEGKVGFHTVRFSKKYVESLHSNCNDVARNESPRCIGQMAVLVGAGCFHLSTDSKWDGEWEHPCVNNNGKEEEEQREAPGSSSIVEEGVVVVEEEKEEEGERGEDEMQENAVEEWYDGGIMMDAANMGSQTDLLLDVEGGVLPGSSSQSSSSYILSPESAFNLAPAIITTQDEEDVGAAAAEYEAFIQNVYQLPIPSSVDEVVPPPPPIVLAATGAAAAAAAAAIVTTTTTTTTTATTIIAQPPVEAAVVERQQQQGAAGVTTAAAAASPSSSSLVNEPDPKWCTTLFYRIFTAGLSECKRLFIGKFTFSNAKLAVAVYYGMKKKLPKNQHKYLDIRTDGQGFVLTYNATNADPLALAIDFM